MGKYSHSALQESLLKHASQHPGCFGVDFQPLGDQIDRRLILGFIGWFESLVSRLHQGFVVSSRTSDHLFCTRMILIFRDRGQLRKLSERAGCPITQGPDSFGNLINSVCEISILLFKLIMQLKEQLAGDRSEERRVGKE